MIKPATEATNARKSVAFSDRIEDDVDIAYERGHGQKCRLHPDNPRPGNYTYDRK
jgi:hypothetical protein